MTVQDYTQTGTESRTAVLGLLTDRKVLTALAPQWQKPGLFADPHLNLVGGWGVNHFLRHGEPIGRQVEDKFSAWAETRRRDPATVDTVRKFLEALSEEFTSRRKKVKSDYTLEVASRVFTRARLKSLRFDLDEALDAGDVQAAAEKVQAFQPVRTGGAAGVNVLTDEASVERALSAVAQEPVIAFPAGTGLHAFFGRSLCRGGFVAFMGSDKTGKSQVLIEMAWQAILQNKNVAFFQCGDLPEEEMVQRFAVRAANRPLDSCTLTVPVGMSEVPAGNNGKGPKMPPVETYTRTWKKPMSAKTALAAFKKTVDGGVAGDRLKLFTYPGDTLTAAAAGATLDGLAAAGWFVDCAIFDYADIMGAEDHVKKDQKRDRINATWVALRALALAPGRKSLVLTATQTDAEAYDKDLLSMKNFSDDKRKFAHVSGMVGINRTQAERDDERTRFNWLVGRAWKYSAKRCLYLAGHPALANPMMVSAF